MSTSWNVTPVDANLDRTETERAAAQVLLTFTDHFNRRDRKGMDECLHFPHVILSAGETVIWDSPGKVPDNFFDDLAAKSGWSRSVYSKREAVLVSKDKVHFVVAYTRNRSDGSVISFHENLWIVTRKDGRWGFSFGRIKGKKSPWRWRKP